MSVVALSDLLFGDLLTETNMKPWWEKMRGYIFAGTVAFALSATYLTLNGITLQCLPIENGNISYACEFGSKQAAWVNSYCSNRLPWFINYFGSLCLASALILLFVSSYWLHKPKVIDSFITFVDMEKKIIELNMTSYDLKVRSCQPIKKDSVDENHLKLREVCGGLWKGGRNIELRDVYLERNVILTACSIFVVVFFTMMLGFMANAGDRFHCKLKDDDKALIHGSHAFPAHFFCVAAIAYRLITFNVIFILSLLLQIAPIWWGHRTLNYQKEGFTNNKNIDFLRFFWKYARPTQSKKFSRLLKYVCGDSVETAIRDNLHDAIKQEDFGLVRVFLALPVYTNKSSNQKEPPEQREFDRKMERGSFLIEKLLDIYIPEVERSPRTEQLQQVEKVVIAAWKCLPKDTAADSCEKFLKYAVAHRRWRLLANTLRQFVSKQSITDGYNLLRRLNVDYDLLDDTYRSFLSYVVEECFKKSLYPIVKQLHEDCTNGFELYVHEGGKSFHIANKINFEDVENFVAQDEGVFESPAGKSQKDIANLLEIFRSSEGDHRRILFDSDFNSELLFIKFQKWDQPARDLAKATFEASNDISRISFIRLLNCYIVPESAQIRTVPLPCGVRDFENINIESVFEWSRLKEERYVIPTAARHIIACMSTEKRRECNDILIRLDFEREQRDCFINYITRCNAEEHISGQQSTDARISVDGQTYANNLSSEEGATSNTHDSTDVRIDIHSSPSERIQLLADHESDD